MNSLAADRVPVLPPNTYEYSLVPVSQRPFFRVGCWTTFFSTVALRKVTAVTPCRHRQRGVTAIAGLLLTYVDDHRETVGQFRLDGAESPLQVTTEPALHMRFSRDGARYLEHVGLAKTNKTEGLPEGTRVVPWSGRLEWWFTFAQAKIYHTTAGAKEMAL